MKKIILSVIIILNIASVNAQNSISGIVTDKNDSKKLVEGVSVFIPEFQKFDVSTSEGKYVIRDIGVGTINIQFTRIGYKSVVKTVSSKEGETALNVEMEPSSVELEEVTVTSNSTKLQDYIPYPVEVVARPDLNRTGNVTLMSALAYQPGIDKISVGNGIAKPVIRGLSFSRILLYQNGTRIENQQWDDRHDLGINENGVENVEVIKGPAALMYGADALGGALIFTDEKPPVEGTKKGDINFGFFSNTLGLNLDAGIKGASNKGVFWSLRAGGQSHTSYVQGEDEDEKKATGEEEEEFAANSKFQSLNAKAVVGISKKWGVSKLSYSFMNQQIGIVELENDSAVTGGNEEEEEQRERELEAPYQDVTSHIITSENTVLAGKSKWNLNLAFQNNERSEFEPLPDKQKENAIGLMLNTVTYDLKWSSDAEKKFGMTIGTQGMFQENENFGKEILVPNADVSDMAIYGIFRYDIGQWNFLAGGRFDLRHIEIESGEEVEIDTADMRPEMEFEKDYQPVNGSIGLAFHPNNQWTLKGNFASGFSAPNYAELGTYGQHEGSYRFEIGNENLEIEQNVESDLGVTWEAKSVAINLSGYRNFIHNYIYIGQRGDSINGLPVYNYRQRDATLTGMEVFIDIHPEKIQWIDFRTSFGMSQGELHEGGNLPWIPAKKVVTELKFQKSKLSGLLNPYISFVVSNYFEQDEVAEYELPTEAYTLLDIHIGSTFHWGKQLVDATLSTTNVLNEGYFNHLSLIKTIGVKEMGRNISLQLKIPFGIKSKS